MKVLLIAMLLALPFSTQAGEILYQGEVTSNYPANMVSIPGILSCPGTEAIPANGLIPGMYVCPVGARLHYDDVLVHSNLIFYDMGVVGEGYMDKFVATRWSSEGEGPYYGTVGFTFTRDGSPINFAGNYTAKREIADGVLLSTSRYKLHGYDGDCGCDVKLDMAVEYKLLSKYPMPYEVSYLLFGETFPIPQHLVDQGYTDDTWLVAPEGHGTFTISLAD
jgi:hypothetical protein